MNIHISNLDTRLNDDDLRSLFAAHGDVASAAVAIDAFTDRSRGFGFVEMPQEEQARAAISALHQTELSGQVISVQEAAPIEERKGSYKVGSGAINPYRFRKN
jgi:RNA recognition motif-containing protein